MQVEHNLLQLDPVGHDLRKIPDELGHEPRACPPRFGLGKADHVANHLVDVQRLLLGRRSAREGPNPRDHVARPPAVAGDGLQPVAHFVEIRRRPGQEAQAGVRVDDDARERLVDLVRDRRGHLSQGRDACDVRQLFLRLAHGLFRLLPFGDVAVGFEHQTPAVRFAHQQMPAFDEDLAAIPGRMRQLARPLAFALQARFKNRRGHRMLRLQQFVARPPNRLFPGEAIEPFGAPVPEHDRSAGTPTRRSRRASGPEGSLAGAPPPRHVCAR